MYSDLGKNECKLFVQKLISNIGSDQKLDDYKLNLLKNMYVLASGHPRTIEFLIEKLERYEEEDWMDIRSCLSDKTKSFGDLLEKVLKKTESPYSKIGSMDKSLMSEYVFRFPVFRDVNDNKFRMLLEKGSLLIYNRDKDTADFITCVQLQSILYLIQSAQWSSFEKSEDERLKIALLLYSDFVYCCI